MTARGFFTLGGALARVWHPAYPLLPWALTSSLLTVAGLWDHWTGRGQVEWIVVGLAAYELMMGLLSDEVAVHGAGTQLRVRDRRDCA